MTDFNNPLERKQWEKEIDSLGGYSTKQLRDQEYDSFIEKNYPNGFTASLRKEYKYGNKYDPNIIIYLMIDEKAILYNTVTGGRFIYIGNKEIKNCFNDAKNNSTRWKELEKVFGY